MYSFESRVRYSELDYEGNITFSSILDYFQDASCFHSEELGLGIEFLGTEKIAWVLVSWQVQVDRYPKYGEKIKISTWPYDFKGFYGYRNFLMTDSEGNSLACANSLWVLLDLSTGRPKKVLSKMIETYQLEPPLSMELAERKMKLPEEMKEKQPFQIQRFHLDTNQHVNNAKYILMAQEYLPEGFKLGKMRAEYKKSAVLGDVIYPYVEEIDGKYLVALNDSQKKPYAIVELEKNDD